MNFDGYAEYPREIVIAACTRIEKMILLSRKQVRQQMIDDDLQQAIRKWKCFWRWVTFGLACRPTVDTVRFVNINARRTHVSMLYHTQFDAVSRIAAMVRNSQGKLIWLSLDAVEYCDLHRDKGQ